MCPVLKISTTAATPESKTQESNLYAPTSGYGYNRFSFITITVFNVVVASVSLFLASPLMLLTAILIKIHDNGPIFYKGVRLGRFKKPFIMYKFRTLPVDAQAIIGTSVLLPHHRMTSPFTKLLRDSRLDELPQFFNVLKGDMDFVGPRPVRPEVYEQTCRDIPNYDLRFTIRPGLVGYSQLFTPHSAPKRLRTKLDNRFLVYHRSLSQDLFFVLYIVIVECRLIAGKGWAFIANWFKLHMLKQVKEERRISERVPQVNSHVVLTFDNLQTEEKSLLEVQGSIVDINYYHLRVFVKEKLPASACQLTLLKSLTVRRKLRNKKALCSGIVQKEVHAKDVELGYEYIISYEPTTELNRYIIDSYFLMQSMA